jgi:hypothetical protein
MWRAATRQTLKGHGMSTLAKSVRVDDDCLWVHLHDGRVVGAPLAWFPRLLAASPAQRSKFELSAYGIHWEDIDEDISVNGLLAGHGDLSQSRHAAVV